MFGIAEKSIADYGNEMPPFPYEMCPSQKLMQRGTAVTFLLLCLSASPVWAAKAAPDALTIRGDTDRGRGIFNGLGNCYQCHGYDALLSRRPTHPPKLAKELALLNPPPADLRDPALKARTKQERLRSLKSHRGTSQLPVKTLTQREMADILAYLSSLDQKPR